MTISRHFDRHELARYIALTRLTRVGASVEGVPPVGNSGHVTACPWSSVFYCDRHAIECARLNQFGCPNPISTSIETGIMTDSTSGIIGDQRPRTQCVFLFWVSGSVRHAESGQLGAGFWTVCQERGNLQATTVKTKLSPAMHRSLSRPLGHYLEIISRAPIYLIC